MVDVNPHLNFLVYIIIKGLNIFKINSFLNIFYFKHRTKLCIEYSNSQKTWNDNRYINIFGRYISNV